jgi:hypothetical protein
MRTLSRLLAGIIVVVALAGCQFLLQFDDRVSPTPGTFGPTGAPTLAPTTPASPGSTMPDPSPSGEPLVSPSIEIPPSYD